MTLNSFTDRFQISLNVSDVILGKKRQKNSEKKPADKIPVDIYTHVYTYICIYTEKYFLNLDNHNQILIEITLFQNDFEPKGILPFRVKSIIEKGNFNPNFVWFFKIRKLFFRVRRWLPSTKIKEIGTVVQELHIYSNLLLHIYSTLFTDLTYLVYNCRSRSTYLQQFITYILHTYSNLFRDLTHLAFMFFPLLNKIGWN